LYYSDAHGITAARSGPLSWYSRHIELDGVLILILLAGSLLALVPTSLEARSIGVLCAAVGWLLLVGAALVASDGRYALPALGPLAAATSIGALGVRRRFTWRDGRQPDNPDRMSA
jgi:hypothetical protein